MYTEQQKVLGIHIVLVVESTFPGHQAYRIYDRMHYTPRGNDTIQNVGWIDLLHIGA